jgi:molybdenum cofactor cytidylyltransferase
VGAVVLAAGSSNRMGQPKLLLPWGRSSTIIRTVSESILRVEGLTDIVLVTGALTPEIRAEVGDLPLRLARNPDPDRGDMLASLQIGLRALWNTVDAALIVLGDQPLIRPETVQGVIQAYSEGKGGIVAPSYQNRRGHPILIDRDFWPAIMELPPGSAPRDVIRANESSIYHLVVDKDSVLRDIDTPEDYQQAHNDRGNY